MYRHGNGAHAHRTLNGEKNVGGVVILTLSWGSFGIDIDLGIDIDHA